jgi:peptide chain release factor subunit 1
VPTGNPSSSSRRAPGRARVTSDVSAALAELLAWRSGGWIVSCYQKLEPGDRAGEKYRIKLKNRLRQAEDRLGILGFTHADREAVTDALRRIEEYFSHPGNLEGARGLALFVGAGLFLIVRLPYVLRSRVLADRSPVVSELVALTEAGTHLLVALADRRSARMFAVGLDGVEELDGLLAPSSTRESRFHEARGSAPGVGEYRFHNRIREEKHRHHALAAEAISRAFRQRAFDGLVVGGTGTDASALLPHLESGVRDKVIGVLRLAPKSVSAAEVRERTLALLSESADTAAAEAVGEVSGLKESGWAIDGVEPTLKALARGQVRTLLVDNDVVLPGYRLLGSGRLTTVSGSPRSEGEALPVADLLDDAIEEALRQRARVLVVSGPLAKRMDRLAALLRFRTGK